MRTQVLILVSAALLATALVVARPSPTPARNVIQYAYDVERAPDDQVDAKFGKHRRSLGQRQRRQFVETQRQLDYDYENEGIAVDAVSLKVKRSHPTKRDQYLSQQEALDDYYTPLDIAVDAVPIGTKRVPYRKHRKPKHHHGSRKRKFFDEQRFFH
uniref:Conserved secreted protein n=1 Tax=Steinernema glaseri TaxID=37863 RepID=A0A1I8AN42_9BILA